MNRVKLDGGTKTFTRSDRLGWLVGFFSWPSSVSHRQFQQTRDTGFSREAAAYPVLCIPSLFRSMASSRVSKRATKRWPSFVLDESNWSSRLRALRQREVNESEPPSASQTYSPRVHVYSRRKKRREIVQSVSRRICFKYTCFLGI